MMPATRAWPSLGKSAEVISPIWPYWQRMEEAANEQRSAKDLAAKKLTQRSPKPIVVFAVFPEAQMQSETSAPPPIARGPDARQRKDWTRSRLSTRIRVL